MERYIKIKEKIRGKYKSLPQNHKKIADYIIDNFDKIPFLSVQDVSANLGTSVASVVRCAQRTGFKGYSELRDGIAETLQAQINNKEIFPLFEKHKIEEDLLTEVANIDITNINDTLNQLDRRTFDMVVNRILSASRVFTAGLGISYLLSEILAYQLTQVGVDASVLKHTYAIFHEQILFMKKKDVLIVFSFPPYSKETVDAAKLAKERGIDVVAITNRNAAPASFYSMATIPVKSENMLFTNSFAAISVVINAIATSCALKKRNQAEKILKETEEIMEYKNQFISGSEK